MLILIPFLILDVWNFKFFKFLLKIVIGNTTIKFSRKQKVLLVYETIIMNFSNKK